MAKINLSPESASDSLQPTAKINEEISNKIKGYFLLLQEKVNENPENVFCVNLDDVWQYCYASRKDAVRALRKGKMFIEGIDFIALRNSAQRSASDIKEHFYLTIQCFEYFVARRNKLIFEIYRRTFHLSVFGSNMKPQQFINVVTIGIENLNQVNNALRKSPYPKGYDSMKQILKLLGYKHLKPLQVFKILIERGLLERIKNHIKIEKDVDIIYAGDDLIASKDAINLYDINENTIKNQMVFKTKAISELFIKAGINLENEEFLSKRY